MKLLIKIFLTFSIILSISQNALADTPYFVDFKYILNESNAGKEAQKFLKNKLEKGIKSLQNKEKAIQEEEKRLFSKKKWNQDDLRLTDLRSKFHLCKKKEIPFRKCIKTKIFYRNELLKNWSFN